MFFPKCFHLSTEFFSFGSNLLPVRFLFVYFILKIKLSGDEFYRTMFLFIIGEFSWVLAGQVVMLGLNHVVNQVANNES